ncbi:MAG TPA: ABC transporter permease [Candidatus Paceibacterota bacterium]|nr:ABC transporter permease [Candidatus Paceibacterota bacterium]HSA02032.1 ABC transporter permease [Candidatus Paceibacterota bacterium]
MTLRRFGFTLTRGAWLPLAVLALWHFASADSVIVPPIGAVLDVLIHPFRDPPTLDSMPLARSAGISVVRVFFGFGLAIVTGVPLGLWIGRIQWASDVFSPSLGAAMVISPVAWIPVTILVFGLASPATVLYADEAWRHGLLDQLRFAIIAVIWMGAFFPIVLNTAAGARGVREAHIEAVRVLGANPWQVLFKVILPSAAPTILTGLRVAGGIAWRVIVAAEIFPGTRGGLGYMIATAHTQASYEYAFAGIVVIGMIGLALDGCLRLLALPVCRWQPRER